MRSGVARVVVLGAVLAVSVSVASQVDAGAVTATTVAAGDVFIADTGHNQVVKVPADGGSQTSIGTGLAHPAGLAVDAAGDVFIADSGNSRVVEVPADGGAQTTVGAGLDQPYGVAVDVAGDVYIADTNNARVVEVPADGGAQTTVGTGLVDPTGMAVDAEGDVFIADPGNSNSQVVEVPADGSGQSTIGTGLFGPHGVAVDAAGDLYIADSFNNRGVEVPVDGSGQTTIGTGLEEPYAVAVDAPPPSFTAESPGTNAAAGTPYSYTYVASTPAGESDAGFRMSSGTLPPGLALDPSTGVLSGTPTEAGSYTFTAEADNAATGTVTDPTTITVSSLGALFVADTGNSQVVEVPADGGGRTTIGTGLNHPYGVAVDAAGDVFIADTGNSQVVEVPADGGGRTTIGTGLNHPYGVTVDAAGDVYIADTGNNQVVEVPADGGSQTTIGTVFSSPSGVAVSAPPPSFTADAPGTHATVGSAYPHYTYKASSPAGEPDAGFRIASGTLPPGLSLDPVTGVLSGTPTAAGSYAFTAETDNAATGSLADLVTITVTRGTQSITFTSTRPPHAVVGALYQATARGGRSGNPVTFTATSASKGSCTATAAGSVHFVHLGTCNLAANQNGNINYAPAHAIIQKIAVARAKQTITFPALKAMIVGATQKLHASASSGNLVSYRTSTPRLCSIHGGRVRALKPGRCIITAHTNYTAKYIAAAATRRLTITAKRA
ncbi:MAG TPA: putative Ig domain-containing protein [Jatrophihabitans sp.]